ncbi:MAG TPA: sugar phosphate isomerase/epimerase [Spirochaetia bacterium]|nr:sugar phosphate isomerase/epimerase [Spirochaetia bacterium]
MAKTRTGQFPIGFRSLGRGWQLSVGDAITFALANGFECIDVRTGAADELARIADGGLNVGTVDLVHWPELASSDAGERKAAAQENVDLVRGAVSRGVKNFFAVAIPKDTGAKRSDNFSRVVDGYGQLCEAIAPLGAHVVLEGWPGPNNSVIGCTPADYRALLAEIPRGLGINFDPSHLIRMGIDPVRFLDEFAANVFHVHGKDTEILVDELYEHGNLQSATFVTQHGFGGSSWRYTIPGHGHGRWGKMLSQLAAAGYKGFVSIELEDEEFNGSEAGEKQGFIAGRSFLEYA